MTSTTAVLGSPVAGLAPDARPNLLRLIGAELRKMVDTRAGFWLQLGSLGLMVTFTVLQLVFGDAADSTFRQMLWISLWPASVLLPVTGILLVSSEWSQRTAPITFALVPRRSRVLVAKLGAAVVLSTAFLAAAFVLGAVGTAIASPNVDATWTMTPGMIGQAALYLTASMIIGLAFGALLLSSAPAIVLYFVLPLTWTFVASISFFNSAGRWLDGNRTFAPLAEDAALNGTDWARIGTTLAVWMLLPLVIGIWRIRRSEIA
jgi:ABC-2 type transport system permease protein